MRALARACAQGLGVVMLTATLAVSITAAVGSLYVISAERVAFIVLWGALTVTAAAASVRLPRHRRFLAVMLTTVLCTGAFHLLVRVGVLASPLSDRGSVFADVGFVLVVLVTAGTVYFTLSRREPDYVDVREDVAVASAPSPWELPEDALLPPGGTPTR